MHAVNCSFKSQRSQLLSALAFDVHDITNKQNMDSIIFRIVSEIIDILSLFYLRFVFFVLSIVVFIRIFIRIVY